jgi:hypothetical protein
MAMLTAGYGNVMNRHVRTPLADAVDQLQLVEHRLVNASSREQRSDLRQALFGPSVKMSGLTCFDQTAK